MCVCALSFFLRVCRVQLFSVRAAKPFDSGIVMRASVCVGRMNEQIRVHENSMHKVKMRSDTINNSAHKTQQKKHRAHTNTQNKYETLPANFFASTRRSDYFWVDLFHVEYLSQLKSLHIECSQCLS